MVRSSRSFAIVCTAGLVYWLEIGQSENYIFSIDYDGGFNESIRAGSFNTHLLGVSGNLLYFLEDDLYEADVLNRTKPRKILGEKDVYHSMLIVDRALQPLGELLVIVYTISAPV